MSVKKYQGGELIPITGAPASASEVLYVKPDKSLTSVQDVIKDIKDNGVEADDVLQTVEECVAAAGQTGCTAAAGAGAINQLNNSLANLGDAIITYENDEYYIQWGADSASKKSLNSNLSSGESVSFTWYANVQGGNATSAGSAYSRMWLPAGIKTITVNNITNTLGTVSISFYNAKTGSSSNISSGSTLTVPDASISTHSHYLTLNMNVTAFYSDVWRGCTGSAEITITFEEKSYFITRFQHYGTITRSNDTLQVFNMSGYVDISSPVKTIGCTALSGGSMTLNDTSLRVDQEILAKESGNNKLDYSISSSGTQTKSGNFNNSIIISF